MGITEVLYIVKSRFLFPLYHATQRCCKASLSPTSPPSRLARAKITLSLNWLFQILIQDLFVLLLLLSGDNAKFFQFIPLQHRKPGRRFFRCRTRRRLSIVLRRVAHHSLPLEIFIIMTIDIIQHIAEWHNENFSEVNYFPFTAPKLTLHIGINLY